MRPIHFVLLIWIISFLTACEVKVDEYRYISLTDNDDVQVSEIGKPSGSDFLIYSDFPTGYYISRDTYNINFNISMEGRVPHLDIELDSDLYDLYIKEKNSSRCGYFRANLSSPLAARDSTTFIWSPDSNDDCPVSGRDSSIEDQLIEFSISDVSNEIPEEMIELEFEIITNGNVVTLDGL